MKESRTVALGFLMLLAASYLDNVRGPLVPVLTSQFKISYGTCTWFLVLGNLGAVVSLFLMLPILQSFSISSVAKFLSVFFIGLALFLYYVTDLVGLFTYGAILGGVISMFGALANLFLIQGTDEKDRSQWMCGLHMVYGGASLIAPLVVSALMARNFSWISPFLFYLPATFFTLGVLFFRQKEKRAEIVIDKQPFGLAKAQWLPITIFCFYVAAEVMVSVWMISYLKDVRLLSLEQSAPYLSGFFVLMTLSRGVCFFSLKEQTEKKMLFGCLLFAGTSLVFGYAGWLWGFVFAGAWGPFFPIFLSQCSRKFMSHSRSFTLWVLASTQLAIGGLNLVMGKVSDCLGLGVAYQIPLFLLGVALILLAVFYFKEKKSLDV